MCKWDLHENNWSRSKAWWRKHPRSWIFSERRLISQFRGLFLHLPIQSNFFICLLIFLASFRFGLWLLLQEARALLGRLEYQRGNLEGALRVFEGIDLQSAIQRLQVSAPPEKPATKKNRPREPPQSVSQHAASLVLEAFYLKAKSLQKLGRITGKTPLFLILNLESWSCYILDLFLLVFFFICRGCKRMQKCSWFCWENIPARYTGCSSGYKTSRNRKPRRGTSSGAMERIRRLPRSDISLQTRASKPMESW